MTDDDIVLQICAGISLFLAASIVVGYCVRMKCSKNEITLKQSPSMEELRSIGIDDPVEV